MKKKLIVILGGGESGIGAALLAKKNGLEIFVSDSGKISCKNKKILKKYDIPFEENGHTESFIINKSYKIIKSPGISKQNNLIKKIYLMGIPILSELEFGKYYIDNNSYIIGITGSNGKTTTSSIIYNILKKSNKFNVGLAGNIGVSFSKEVLKKRDLYVLEISSFQIDDSSNFHINIAILLNITRDHLDIYNNMENYIYSKFRITCFQNKNDFFIYNYDDPIIRLELNKHNFLPKCIPFSAKKKLSYGFYLDKNYNLCYKEKKHYNTYYKIRDIYLFNNNIYNIMAALIVSKILDVDNRIVNSVLKIPQTIEHRMEKIPYVINGVKFINDSKSTNIGSVFFALKNTNNPIIWIAGGIDKGNNYEEIISVVKKKVKAIICLGVNNLKIYCFFKNIVPIIIKTNNMKKAVYISYKLSNPGDNILLSPACSSFDLFKNYVERGNKFKEEIKNLFYSKKNEKNRY
ncbi:UDP-N-acetylmuramoyl-L-alanine--D-glutamate ligase [Blattabacterium cuenoti]|uniref:UDP-N-acetylmuramoyl-L-alanine--D-glutamate ligase n=1 Tax=Blattabacterium cuenoti TaxID=1653831 RepID=UPI00163BBA96|nr:UDP-N-acetylmuramoyl-L-alanine--D-glutamate ligase [Blattabacterium cuenoti]